MVEQYFGGEAILSKTGPVDPAKALNEVKLIAIYFSAHWCPPCRRFTPVLRDVYNEVNANGKVFEVVFSSADNSDEEFQAYYDEMPWLALPFEDPRG